MSNIPPDPRSNARDGLPVAKILSTSGAQPPPKPKTPPEPEFEIVDDEITPQGSVPPRPREFEVVDENDDDLPPPPKRKIRVDEDDDEKVLSARKAKKKKKRKKSYDDDDDDDSPLTRKKKRGMAYTREELDKHYEEANKIQEWGVPIALIIFGLGMMLFSTLRLAGKEGDAGIMLSTGAMLLFTLIYAIVSIPITIVGLMLIGMMVGIEYGTPISAIRNLAAITFIANGILWLGSSFGVMGIIVFPISGIVTFGLFMTLFRLDVWETWISLIGLNLLSKAMQFLMILLIAAMAAKAARSMGKFSKDPDDVPPAWNQKGGGWQNQGGHGGVDDD